MGSLDAYRVIKEIGKGSFGTVSKVQRKSDNKILVWKELNYGKMNEKEKQLLVSEVNILREFRSNYIVRYYDRIIDREHTKIYIVMEYCDSGDLATMIKQNRRARTCVDPEMVWKIFSQIVLGLSECHTRKGGKVLHRDLKPGNIFLVQENKDTTVKLGDFGLARIMGSDSLFARTYVGTPFYMSPEQLADSPYDEKSDIWSLGCLIYELCALYPPFEAMNQPELTRKIQRGTFKRIPSCFDESLQHLLERMICIEKSKRPTVQELLGHRQISLRLRERKVAQQIESIKRREAELEKRLLNVEERENALGKGKDAIPSSSSSVSVASDFGKNPLQSSNHSMMTRRRALSSANPRPPRPLDEMRSKENTKTGQPMPKPTGKQGLNGKRPLLRQHSAPQLPNFHALGLNERLNKH